MPSKQQKQKSGKKQKQTPENLQQPATDELPMRISRCCLPGMSYSETAPPLRGQAVVDWVDSMLDSADDGLVLKWSTAEMLSGDCIALSSVEGKEQKEVHLGNAIFLGHSMSAVKES